MSIDQTHRSLWRRYTLALFIIIALITTSHLASTSVLDGGEEAASTVNISGRQRMLSQRILYLAEKHQHSGGAEKTLVGAIDLFERSHYALRDGGDLGLTEKGAARRRPVYDELRGGTTLDEMSLQFIEAARSLVGNHAESEQALQRLAALPADQLLRRLDAAVGTFEAQSQRRNGRARLLSNVTFVAALLIILCEALWIFRPAQLVVSRSLRKLQVALADSERASVAKDRFLANMSHELRTPLNGLLGMLGAMRESEFDTQTRERLEVAQIAADHLSELLNGILDLSRIDSGKFAVEVAPFSPRRCADDVAALYADTASEKGIGIKIEDNCLPDHVSGDQTRFRQILANLLGNAVKFTQVGQINIRLLYTDGMLQCEVTDTGIGIEKNALTRLFNRFEQAETSTHGKYGGTGLGLAICKELVELMGGEIAATSEIGIGSTFSFALPAPRTEAPPSLLSPSTDEPLEPMQILLVEDNEVNQKVAVTILSAQNHSVTVATNGREALELVRVGSFDIVLMDMVMPEMDGLAATRAIRALSSEASNVPILGISANAFPEDRTRCLEAGMTGFMTKPIKPSILARELRSAIARHEVRPPGSCRRNSMTTEPEGH